MGMMGTRGVLGVRRLWRREWRVMEGGKKGVLGDDVVLRKGERAGRF
jgi:hypothetical protein